MKIFTKVLFTLALLVVGVAGTRASRVNLTFDNDSEETIDNTDIADVTIYGGARTNDTQDGSVKVTEAYAEVTGDDVDRCIVYDGEAKTNPWDKQAVYDLPTAMVQGKTYIVKADIKSAKGGECALWPIDNDSENKNEWGAVSMFNIWHPTIPRLLLLLTHGSLKPHSLTTDSSLSLVYSTARFISTMCRARKLVRKPK
jgi:hypothetical protein